MIHLDYNELKKKISHFFRYTQSGKKRIAVLMFYRGRRYSEG